jgi:hypothetical protein
VLIVFNHKKSLEVIRGFLFLKSNLPAYMQDEIKTCISAGIWWHDLSGATNY